MILLPCSNTTPEMTSKAPIYMHHPVYLPSGPGFTGASRCSIIPTTPCPKDSRVLINLTGEKESTIRVKSDRKHRLIPGLLASRVHGVSDRAGRIQVVVGQ